MAQKPRNPPAGMQRPAGPNPGDDGGGGTMAMPSATPSGIGMPSQQKSEEELYTKDELIESQKNVAWMAQLETVLYLVYQENTMRPIVANTVLVLMQQFGFVEVKAQEESERQE